MENPQAPKISILIVTFNNGQTIRACLDSLELQTISDCEILVIDNQSTDNTVSLLKSNRRIHLTESPVNIGFAAATNRLAKNALGDYLFLLNPDCVCPPETLRLLLEFASKHPGAISPALVFPNGTLQPSARRLLDYDNIIFSRRSPLHRLALANTQKGGYIVPDAAAIVPAVSATALFISKKLFLEVGAFDERFFMYCEDIDLCNRLAKHGSAIWYYPELKIVHLLRASSRKKSLKPLYHHHLSVHKYFTKHYPDEYIKNLILSILLAAGFVFSAAAELLRPGRLDD